MFWVNATGRVKTINRHAIPVSCVCVVSIYVSKFAQWQGGGRAGGEDEHESAIFILLLFSF